MSKQQPRQRATKILQHSGEERIAMRKLLIQKLLKGEMTQGEALKAFRLNIIGLKQTEYAEMVKVSRKTISDLENDNGNYSLKTINQVFRPLGLHLGLIPISNEVFSEFLKE